MKAGLLGVERQALYEVRRRGKLLAAHLAGNAVLLAGAYGWLWIAERTVFEVVLSALLAVAVVFGALWLHATALAAFHAEAGRLPVRPALRRLPRVLPWILLIAVVIAAAVWLAEYAPKVTAYLASLLTLRLRTPVGPREVDWVYPAFLRGACCVVVLVLVPLASQAAAGGRVRRALRVAARPRYWLACAMLLLAGLYLPARLVGWVPAWENLSARVASVTFRFGLAYALAVMAWLTLAAIIAQFAGKPVAGGNDDVKAPG